MSRVRWKVVRTDGGTCAWNLENKIERNFVISSIRFTRIVAVDNENKITRRRLVDYRYYSLLKALETIQKFFSIKIRFYIRRIS